MRPPVHGRFRAWPSHCLYGPASRQQNPDRSGRPPAGGKRCRAARESKEWRLRTLHVATPTLVACKALGNHRPWDNPRERRVGIGLCRPESNVRFRAWRRLSEGGDWARNPYSCPRQKVASPLRPTPPPLEGGRSISLAGSVPAFPPRRSGRDFGPIGGWQTDCPARLPRSSNRPPSPCPSCPMPSPTSSRAMVSNSVAAAAKPKRHPAFWIMGVAICVAGSLGGRRQHRG